MAVWQRIFLEFHPKQFLLADNGLIDLEKNMRRLNKMNFWINYINRGTWLSSLLIYSIWKCFLTLWKLLTWNVIGCVLSHKGLWPIYTPLSLQRNTKCCECLTSKQKLVITNSFWCVITWHEALLYRSNKKICFQMLFVFTGEMRIANMSDFIAITRNTFVCICHNLAYGWTY